MSEDQVQDNNMHKDRPVKENEAKELIQAKTEKKLPGLFDIDISSCLPWCCFSIFCTTCAMFAMGRKLKEELLIRYVLLFIVAYWALRIADNANLFSIRFGAKDVQYMSTVLYCALALTFLAFIFAQRRRFRKRIKT